MAAPVLIRRATLADAPEIARVHVQVWQESYQGIVPDEALARLDVAARERVRRQLLGGDPPEVDCFLAIGDGAILGFIDVGPARDSFPPITGEVRAINILAAAQRCGIGRWFMTQAARALAARGSVGAMLWVFAHNAGARAFYERLGGQRIGEQDITVGDKRLREIAYGWPDLDLLVSNAGGAEP